MTAHTSMRGGVNNYLILQYAKLIFGLYQAVASSPAKLAHQDEARRIAISRITLLGLF
jgi:hypothetical protein